MTSAPLGELVDIRGGGTPRRDNPAYWNGNIPWATVKDFKTTEISKTLETISEPGVKESATSVIPAGNIIVPTRMALGKVAINRIDLAINQDLKALLIHDRKRVDGEYLFRFLLSKSAYIEGQGKGATVKGITLDVLRELEVPLPSLAEQKRIAAILNKADAIRRKRQQAIQLADKFMLSVFLDMFGDPVRNPMGWDERPLESVAEIRSGATKGRTFADRRTVTLPYMRVANVQDGRIDTSDIQYIEVLESEVNRYSLQAGDLLLTEGGDPDKLGRGAVWYGDVAPCLHQNHIFAVRVFKNTVHPEFLSAQIASQRGKRYFLKVGKQTTGIATINKTVLSGYPALVPPMPLQQQYVKLLERVRSGKVRISNSLEMGGQLFDSIAQRAFRGEL